jgi:hypothetical protein
MGYFSLILKQKKWKYFVKYNAASKRYIWRETKSIGQLENAHMPNKVTNKKQIPDKNRVQHVWGSHLPHENF